MNNYEKIGNYQEQINLLLDNNDVDSYKLAMRLKEEINKLMSEEDFNKFELVLTDLLDEKIGYDLAGSGMYFDDDIGEQEFNDDVEQVREHIICILWDCYNDNIEDVVIEELGSDFKYTI